MNKQRTVVYGLRRRILKGEEIQDEIVARIEEAADLVVSQYAVAGNYPENWDREKLYAELKRAFDVDYAIPEADLHATTAEAAVDQVIELAKAKYARIEEGLGSEQLREIERQVLLGVIDHLWREHLHSMDHLRDATRFRGYAQKDPLQEYKKEGFAMFAATLERVAMEVATRILHIDPDFIKKQQEAILKAREIEIQRMRQMQFSAPEGPVVGPAQSAQQGREIPVTINATPAPAFSGPLQGRPVAAPAGAAPAAPPRPAPMPGSMPVRAPGPAMQAPIDIRTIGRNDPCPCGSGKKFKKCHGEGR